MRALALDREPVIGVERRDHDDAEDGQEGAEQRADRQPGQRELEASADGRHASRVESVAEQPVATGVLPDGVERQRRQVERDAVEDDGIIYRSQIEHHAVARS